MQPERSRHGASSDQASVAEAGGEPVVALETSWKRVLRLKETSRARWLLPLIQQPLKRRQKT